jgi:hypothetical protein
MVKKYVRYLAVVLFVFAASVLQASDCTRTSVGFIPIMDGLGLYPSGLNTPPPAHITQGQARAAQLKSWPRMVLMSVGMSNTNQHFEAFRRVELQTTDKAANLKIVNGATGKQVSSSWADPNNDCYVFADEKLAMQGALPKDVGVLWVLVTNAANGAYPIWRAGVKKDTRQALLTLVAHYPNVQLIFLSSMPYGGYQPPIGGLHPEPHSYDHGLIMRELITEHLKGTLLPGRWIEWGPYLWADGLVPRSDGLTWACSDYVNDGCHPTAAGGTKVAEMLSGFFRHDPVAKMWFLPSSGGHSR